MCFHKKNTTGTSYQWRCTKYWNGCPARGVAPSMNGVIRMTSGADTATKHNHDRDPVSPQKRHRYTALKQASVANKTTPSMALAADAQEGLQPFELQRFASQRALQQVVNRARKVPGSKLVDAEPAAITFPDELKRTIRGQPFLVVDTRAVEPTKPPIFAFCSPFGMQLLREHQSWAADGTFFAAPKYSDQLLTINVLIGKSSIPAAYVVMPNHQQETYSRAFKALFSLDGLKEAAPTSFVTDFELALSNALSEQFPNAQVKYCQFHLAKAVYSNILRHRLQPLYEIDDVRALLRAIPALTCIPVADVPSGFRDICDTLDELQEEGTIDAKYKSDLKNFLHYFRRTYVGYTQRGRMIPPRYPIGTWNCFTRTLHGEARTNNAVEGWHTFLNSKFPRAKMPMSQFVARIQKEDERCYNLVTRHGTLNELNPASSLRGKPSAISVREQNLRELVATYNEMTAEQRGNNRLLHLLKAQYHLSPTAFARVDETRREDDENETPCSSQGSNAGTGSSQGSNGAGNSQGSNGAACAPASSSAAHPAGSMHSWGSFTAFSFDEDN
ncbi:hypothetical protein AAVH_13370 [Aphelenchoides avenae]|nr:hypothetical protein AAVH_13370 [Aphelenchus avenae]